MDNFEENLRDHVFSAVAKGVDDYKRIETSPDALRGMRDFTIQQNDNSFDVLISKKNTESPDKTLTILFNADQKRIELSGRYIHDTTYDAEKIFRQPELLSNQVFNALLF